jgi:ATP-dependent Clp endopeptidase proteolytic subunit ClpP
MSEEQTPVSPEHAAALVRVTEAEASKHEAEARYFDARRFREEQAGEAQTFSLEQQRLEHVQWQAYTGSRTYHFNSPVSDASVQQCVKMLNMWSKTDPGCEIEIIFNSPGGSVIDGLALFDFLQTLRERGHRIVTGTYGMAASMAGILLQAGDHRWVGEQAWILIHRTAFGAIGKAYEIEDRVKWIERIEKRVIDIFVRRSGKKLTPQKIRKNWERKDWWLDAEEALELGVVDEIRSQLM